MERIDKIECERIDPINTNITSMLIKGSDIISHKYYKDESGTYEIIIGYGLVEAIESNVKGINAALEILSAIK